MSESYKSWIQQKQLIQIIEEWTADEITGDVPQSSENLLKFFQMDYFLLNEDLEDDSFQMLDALKIICFIILISKEKEEK